MKDLQIVRVGRCRLSFAWYDLWIGAFIDTERRKLYLCFVPMLLCTIEY